MHRRSYIRMAIVVPIRRVPPELLFAHGLGELFRLKKTAGPAWE